MTLMTQSGPGTAHFITSSPHNRHQAYWELENNRLGGFAVWPRRRLVSNPIQTLLGRNG
jgi:hypothetical protein